MHQIKAGLMLHQIREQKKIPRKKLCAGLCSAGTLSKYESGERIPDGLVFHCFMQRMGINPDNFSVMLSLKEYQYYAWKKSVFEAIQKQAWETADQLSHSSFAKDRSCNVKIQNQFYLYLSFVLAEKTEKNPKKALQLLQKAINETVPDYLKNDLEVYRLSTFEIGLMALYYYKGGILHLLSPEEVYAKLKALITYTTRHITDKQECARLVPGMVCILLNLCQEQTSFVEKLFWEEEAVKLLKESYGLYHLPELLRFYIEDLQKVDAEKAHVYENQYRAFMEVLEDAGYDTSFQPELLFDSPRQLYLLNEYMRSYREINSLTQEQVSDGICAVETYSRLENGKSAPHLKEREAILKRLQIGWGYFRGDLETTDYKLFEYLEQFKENARKEDWQKAEAAIAQIRLSLDMNSINNQQYMGMMENRAAYAAGQISEEEFYRRDKKLLELSVNEEHFKKTDLYYFSHIELVLYTHLANILRIQGRQQEGIQLLKRMLEKIAKSQVSLEYWWDSIRVVIFNLANMLSDIGDYEASLKYMTAFIDTCFKLSDGKFAGIGIGEQALDLEQLGGSDKAVCSKKFEQVFYLTDFYNLTVNHSLLKEYYEQNYEADKQWY